MKYQNIILATVITAVIAGGIGYKVGVRTQGFGRFDGYDDQSNGRGQMMQGKGRSDSKQYGDGQGMMGRGPAQTGEVTAKDGKTLTLKMSDGSTKLLILSDTTSYRASTESSLDKVEVGTKIAAFGTQSTDGSTVATSIEINPMSLRK